MTVSRFAKEMLAAQSLAKVLAAADECRRAHEDAGMALPEPLMRLLGLDDEPARTGPNGSPLTAISPPKRPPAPPEATDDWIWVEADKLLTTNLTLGILRAKGAPMQPSEIVREMQRFNPNASKGTIANIGTRLDGDKIQRGENGWMLMPNVAVPVFSGPYAWGLPEMFETQELAAHRRLGIVHVLGQYPDGLQIVQLTNMLRDRCAWNKAPVSKDLIKMDMQALDEEGRVKRVGGSTRKWRAAT